MAFLVVFVTVEHNKPFPETRNTPRGKATPHKLVTLVPLLRFDKVLF
jgi:hypothetical protein